MPYLEISELHQKCVRSTLQSIYQLRCRREVTHTQQERSSFGNRGALTDLRLEIAVAMPGNDG